MRLIAPVVMLYVFNCAVVSAAQPAPERLVFEDFETVQAWEGFELSDDRAHSGGTSALWRNMPERTSAVCEDIPHDWTEWNAFTFWVYNVKKLPAAFMCIIRSENPDTEGMDYWAIRVRLNFTGWKRFGIMLREGGGARSPVGWHSVDHIRFTASGWGNEPNPEAVVYIDQLELRKDIGGPGPYTTEQELFELLRDDIDNLAPARRAAGDGEFDAAKEHLLAFMRQRQWPEWKVSHHEWQDHRQQGYDTSDADRVCDHVFGWFGRQADLGEDIDWTANGFDPDEPEFTPEWTYDLNRFYFWRTLGRAYWATGDEKYAQEFVSQMLDWVHDQPPPVLGNPNSAPTWRTIEQGIRTAGSWMDAYHYFVMSPSMTPDAHCTFLRSFVDHARTLTRMAVEHPEHGGNWVTMECNGLATIGCMFPELKEAEHWRDVAYGRLYDELDRQVYPDGAQKELTTGYHQVARGNFMRALWPAEHNDFEIPDGYLDRLKRMYEYNLHAMMPNDRLPALNDAGYSGVRGSLQEAYERWGDPQFLWGATDGAEGEPVDFTSRFFPWAGQAVMRTGWDDDDVYMMFEIGPFGIGHQHEDKLGIMLYGYGRVLLTEAGTYTYDHSKWRRFVLSTAAHNTIMVDGMGQHRRGLRETYENEEPMEGVWEHTDVFDWCTGRYESGYGPDRLKVTHERTVLFVRPDYFVVIDRLVGDNADEHTYQNLFNLNADSARIAADGLTVHSTEAGEANLTLVPVAREGLSVRIAKGETDPLLGWVPRESHREIPTAVYERAGATPQAFVTVLLPHPTEAGPEFEAEIVDRSEEAIAIRAQSEHGEDVILCAFDEAARMDGAGVSAMGRAAVVRKSDDGEVTGAVAGGTDLTVNGRQILKQ